MSWKCHTWNVTSHSRVHFQHTLLWHTPDCTTQHHLTTQTLQTSQTSTSDTRQHCTDFSQDFHQGPTLGANLWKGGPHQPFIRETPVTNQEPNIWYSLNDLLLPFQSPVKTKMTEEWYLLWTNAYLQQMKWKMYTLAVLCFFRKLNDTNDRL